MSSLAHNDALEPPTADLALIRAGRNLLNESDWENACRQLLESWEAIVQGMAHHYAPGRSDQPDYAQVARVALLRAARHYRHRPGRRFVHYARRTLRNALIDEAKRAQARRCLRGMLAAHSTADPSSAEGGLASLLQQETCDLIRKRIGGWNPRLQLLTDYVFFQELSQVEAARQMGLTPARINQLLHEVRQEGRRDLCDLVG